MVNKNTHSTSSSSRPFITSEQPNGGSHDLHTMVKSVSSTPRKNFSLKAQQKSKFQAVLIIGIGICAILTAPQLVFVLQTHNGNHYNIPETAEDVIVSLKLLQAWRQSAETCGDWFAIQKFFKSYIDVYIVGSQKGATTQLSINLHNLGIRQPHMLKEWHFFNTLNKDGYNIPRTNTIADPLPLLNISKLRWLHYKSGFPKSTFVEELIPTIDNSEIDNRKLTIDSSVEYFHSDRSAFLASSLTPHAKIVVTVRNPLDRALSQYNMFRRESNQVLRSVGKPDRPSTRMDFHEFVVAEIKELMQCGYNYKTGAYEGKTSKLVSCLFAAKNTKRQVQLMLVYRGLYHLHLRTWLDHFPSHRILVLSFKDLIAGKHSTYHDISKFLCMRKFPDRLLHDMQVNGTNLSFGQRAAKDGVNRGTVDTYEGNDSYLAHMHPKTEELLRDFYAKADMLLFSMLGHRFY